MGKWRFAGYTLLAGLLMSVFVLTQGMFKHVFSLGALLVGMSFFKKTEEKKHRVWFVILVLLQMLLLPLVYAAMAYVNGWYINPGLLVR